MSRGKPRSRVAEEAEEKRAKARELDRRIRELNRQISNPRERPPAGPVAPEANASSPLGRFLRLVKAEEDGRRLPLLKEKRRHRNRTILWGMAGLIAFFWAMGKLLHLLSR